MPEPKHPRVVRSAMLPKGVLASGYGFTPPKICRRKKREMEVDPPRQSHAVPISWFVGAKS